ncbi:MAG TPA: AAA family ATPase, partial [Candidatus Cloacimonadota bacterium]|nr:AAA family ATPase [Candidatus Cloacimonadota bacterium]
MLLSFTVKNWMCFKEETTIDFFEKHNQTKFRERIVKLKGHKVNLFSAIFGANASGKSSIMKALMLLKNMVDGRSLSYNPYRLDGNSENTVFEIVFSIKEDIFLFKISYNNNQVENE